MFFCGKAFSFLLMGVNTNLKKSFKYIRAGWYSRYFKGFGMNTLIGSSPEIFFGENVEIGSNVVIGKRLRIETIPNYLDDIFLPRITIGDNVGINDDCHISAIDHVVIGDNVLIASKVFISDNLHGTTSNNDLSIPPTKRKLYSKGGIIIESNVWIGEGVAILSGVIIGEGAIIGSNSVVTKNVPPFSVVAGVPAREIIKNSPK